MSPIRPDLHGSMPGLSGGARRTALAVAVAMAALGVSHTAMSQTASDSDVQALKSELQQLHRKIDRLEAQQSVQQSAQNAPSRETEALKETRREISARTSTQVSRLPINRTLTYRSSGRARARAASRSSHKGRTPAP
jgi:TolA-binding protein